MCYDNELPIEYNSVNNTRYYFSYRKQNKQLFYLCGREKQVFKMTSVKNINIKQKEAMADFISEHPNLAKNLLPNCGRGRVVANRLWEALTVRLNSFGPPTKNAKSWRKVYTDQKFNVKKKVSFNKAAKKKTGGGPYEEMILSSAEEQILQAAGIDVAVEGLSAVQTFGSAKKANDTSCNEEDSFMDTMLESECENENAEEDIPYVGVSKPKCFTKAATKLELLESNIKKFDDHQTAMASKLDRLLDLKERSLRLKEEKHAANMQIKKIELEIKSIELQILKKQNYNL